MITVETEEMNEIFTKYHLKGLPFEPVIHHIKKGDLTGDPHDHPWSFTSFVMKGEYTEERYTFNSRDGIGWYKHEIERKQGTSFEVDAKSIHRIISTSEGGCYTIITPKEKSQRSGFWRFDSDQRVYYRPWDEKEFKPYKS